MSSVTAESNKPTVVVVTGLSGAGKSTALRSFEDLGFFCVDNLPTVLTPQAVKVCEEGGMSRVALGMDVRVRSFLAEVGDVLRQLAHGGQRDVHVVFLDASDETILRRFSESRRPHPLAAAEADAAPARATTPAIAVLDGVRLERERLAPLRAAATCVFDTTHLSVHELRRWVVAQFGPAAEGATRMLTRVVSFGFKYGMPVDADLVLDVRFLENPYFIPNLKHLPGTDPSVSKFVLGLPEAQEFLERTRQLLTFMIPKYEREGKSYLTIGIGCTGGRHRSVVLADAIADLLAGEFEQRPERPRVESSNIVVVHRDVARSDATKHGPDEPERRSHTEIKETFTPAAVRGGEPERPT